MRIILMTDTFYPYIDGIVTFLKSISIELGKNGHQVLILSPKYSKNGENDEIDLGENVKVIRIESVKLLNYENFKFSKLKFLKVEKIIKNFKPDVIHIQTPAPMGIMGGMIAKKNKIPCIGTYHTYLPDFVQCISPKNFINWEKIKSNHKKMKNKSDFLYVLINPIIKIFEKESLSKKDYDKKKLINLVVWTYTNSIYNQCDLVTTPTQVLVDDLKKHKLKRPIYPISNGLDLTTFSPKENYDFKGKFLHVGRISFEKEIDILIKSFAIAQKNYEYITLDIYGDGPALNELKLLVKNNDYENVIFHGRVPREDLPKIYREHDVFLTSSPIETQGLVAIEAASCGLPLIGVNRLGIKEAIENGKNGYLVKVQDTRDFSKAIKLIIENKDKIESMGNKSVLMAKDHDFKIVYKKFEDLYEYAKDIKSRKLKKVKKIKSNQKNKKLIKINKKDLKRIKN